VQVTGGIQVGRIYMNKCNKCEKEIGRIVISVTYKDLTDKKGM